jgi:hypothetical protein
MERVGGTSLSWNEMDLLQGKDVVKSLLPLTHGIILSIIDFLTIEFLPIYQSTLTKIIFIYLKKLNKLYQFYSISRLK